ncbi:unnamed protein product [Ambrosiozyma monospora]|uniref:Unnamed protein product n=1 Tax=Ambrosiozyma monospora TaxID=43982 RepID=A0ACB5TI90_AMBMO|nr:unnamed protein product [Ambrosiozyma monospora]
MGPHLTGQHSERHSSREIRDDSTGALSRGNPRSPALAENRFHGTSRDRDDNYSSSDKHLRRHPRRGRRDKGNYHSPKAGFPNRNNGYDDQYYNEYDTRRYTEHGQHHYNDHNQHYPNNRDESDSGIRDITYDQKSLKHHSFGDNNRYSGRNDLSNTGTVRSRSPPPPLQSQSQSQSQSHSPPPLPPPVSSNFDHRSNSIPNVGLGISNHLVRLGSADAERENSYSPPPPPPPPPTESFQDPSAGYSSQTPPPPPPPPPPNDDTEILLQNPSIPLWSVNNDEYYFPRSGTPPHVSPPATPPLNNESQLLSTGTLPLKHEEPLNNWGDLNSGPSSPSVTESGKYKLKREEVDFTGEDLPSVSVKKEVGSIRSPDSDSDFDAEIKVIKSESKPELFCQTPSATLQSAIKEETGVDLPPQDHQSEGSDPRPLSTPSSHSNDSPSSPPSHSNAESSGSIIRGDNLNWLHLRGKSTRLKEYWKIKELKDQEGHRNVAHRNP